MTKFLLKRERERERERACETKPRAKKNMSSDKETETFNLEKKVLVDIEKLGNIEDTYEYVNKSKDDLQKLDGVLKSLSADGFVRFV